MKKDLVIHLYCFKLRSSSSRLHILYLHDGVEGDISQEPEVTDPKCGISNKGIPYDRIHLVGVPGLKSKVFDDPLLVTLKKKLLGQELGWIHGPIWLILVSKYSYTYLQVILGVKKG